MCQHELSADKPEVVKALQQLAREQLSASKPPLMEINQPKYEKIVQALAQ